MRTIQRVSGNVIPKRLAFDVLHDKKSVIEPYSLKLASRATDGGNQTGSTITNRSKCRQPILAAGSPLGDVVIGHLVTEQGHPAGSGLDNEHNGFVAHLFTGQSATQWFCFFDMKRLK